MLGELKRFRGLFVLSTIACFVLAGCGAGGLPATNTVTLPDGTTQNVTLGSGVISLANTEWQFFRTASNAAGAAFVKVQFGAEGNLEAFADNTIASYLFGSTVLFDGQKHDTSQASISYAAATYGAETSDATGFAFVTEMVAYAGPLSVATMTATATAEYDPDDPNVVYGEFEYTAELSSLAESFVDIPAESLSDSFTFMGQKVD